MPTRKKTCHACQRLRIGCDITSRAGDPCSNCVRRGRDCTFELQQDQTRTPGRSVLTPTSISAGNQSPRNGSASPFGPPPAHRRDVGINLSPLPSHDLAGFMTEDVLSRQNQALTLHYMLWNIFTGILEPQLVIWTGSECCPFKQTFNAPTTLISRLMLTLDDRRQKVIDPEFARNLGLNSETPELGGDLVKQALLSAVHAFAARWLPTPWKTKHDLMVQLWTCAHRQIYTAMTRPTYCSILALYIFGITPTSTANTQKGASDLCLEVSLQQYKKISIRSRARLYQSLSTLLLDQEDHALPTEAALEFSQMENTAYWLGIICDTSRTLTTCQPSILLPGHSSDDKLWKCIRNEISSFEQRSRSWRTSRLPISIENIYSIIQHGSAYVILVWKAISNVQAALFHEVQGTSVEMATEIAMQELNRFEDVFGPLLGLCRRDFIILNEKIRMSCFFVNLHYSLGVLILVDTLSATSYSRLLVCEYELRISSARAIVNFISLVLQTDHSSTGSHSENSNLLQVPYPEHVVNGLARAGHSLLRLYQNKSVSASMVETMFSVIFTALKILQRISYSAEEEYTCLLSHCDDTGQRPQEISNIQESPSALYGSVTSPSTTLGCSDSFQTEAVNELGELIRTDPTLLETTIARYEGEALIGPNLHAEDRALRTQSYI